MSSVVWFFICIFDLFVTLNAQNGNCVYHNLNISGLYGLLIACPFSYNNTIQFLYEPCESNLQCSIYDLDDYMVIQNTTSGGCVAGIAVYDPNVLPQKIDFNGTEAYKLSYANGETSYSCFGPRKIDIIFICDPNADPYDKNELNCGEYAGQICSYYFEIPTVYACNIEPENECIWKSQDGNYTLDLSTFKNQTLVTIDSKNATLFGALSPCSNSLRCNDQNVSSKIVDIIENQCVDYLSIWENGLIGPKYDSSTKTWQFIYTNGQKCDGLENIFEVYWKCDYHTKNTANVISFEEIDICTFVMHINSSYACW